MTCFINNGIQGYQLASINRCCSFLKAIFLSDITNGAGIFIARSAYNGDQHQSFFDTYEWPTQGKPGEMDWFKWKQAINSSFDVRSPILRLSLSYRLREWDKDITPQQWRWWYCEDSDKLYNRMSNTTSYIYETSHCYQRLHNRVYIWGTITGYDF